MKWGIINSLIVFICAFHVTHQDEVRLLDLEPQDAKQIIEQQDTSLKYAPKVESNVPAVRYLGNEPHQVVEDIYLANQYHGQDGLGGYLYGYSVPDIAKSEKKQAGGDLRGAYNYIAGNGQEIKVEYWDDGTGFHQIDNVPKNLPEDLPEVKKAKDDFMKIWQEQAERNSHPVEDPYNSEGQYKEGPLSVQGQLHRQQQFAAQFGKAAGYPQAGGYQAAASQQKPIYQSNLEKSPQTYNPNYQPYQGRDQQNQGAYQSKQYSSGAKGPQYISGSALGQNQPTQGQGTSGYAKASAGSVSGYGQSNPGQIGGQASGSYGGQASGSYGGQKSWSAPGVQGGQSQPGQGGAGYGKPNVGPAQGYGQTNQDQSSGGFGQGQVGAQSQGGFGYGQGNVAGHQGQASPGYGQPGQNSGGAGYGQGNQGKWAQPGQKTGYQSTQGGYQSQYQGQSSDNVNKYAPKPQTSSYGQQGGAYGGQSGHNQQGQEDDGEYRETDEGAYNEKDEEQQGPPKGFFYKFDYPVGIIVSKQGPAKVGGQEHQAAGYGQQAGAQGHQAGGYGQQATGYGQQAGAQGNQAGGYGQQAGGYGHQDGGYQHQAHQPATA